MKTLHASLIALVLAAMSSAVLARSSDRNQPMDVDAGATDYSVNDSRPTILSGGVVITQGTLDIRSGRAEISQRGGEPVRVVLTGSPVRLTQVLDNGERMNATARQIDYDLRTEIVVLTGGVTLAQPGNSLSGERIVYNMQTGRVQGGGEGAGRVKMRILPRNSGGAAATPQPQPDQRQPSDRAPAERAPDEPAPNEPALVEPPQDGG